MLLAVVISVVAVASGLGLGLAPAVTRRAIGPLRTLSFTAVLAVVFLHLLPEALRDLGPLGLLVFGLGLALPRWTASIRGEVRVAREDDNASFQREPRASLASRALSVWPRLGLELGFWGLLIHHVGDGLALGAYSRVSAPDEHVHSDVLLALVLHTVPLVAVVTSSYVRAFGMRSALARGVALAVASLVGVLFAGSVPSIWVDLVRPWIAASVSGLLLHSLAHDLGSDLPTTHLRRFVDFAMAVLGGVLGYWGERLSSRVEHVESAVAKSMDTVAASVQTPIEFALRLNLERLAAPLLVGAVFGAWLPIIAAITSGGETGADTERANQGEPAPDAHAPHSIKSGAWSPEAFLLNLAHFGFVFAIVRDAASLLGLALRVPAKDTVRRVATEIAAADVPHSSPAAKKSSVLERVALRFDAQVAWALLGVLAAAVVNVALPDASLLPYVLTGTLGMAIFAASVPLHAAAAPPLALALMGKGLAWPAGFLLVWLAPLSAELDWKRRVPLAALGALSLELAARFWALPSPVMPTGFGTPAAALFLVLVAYRAYRVGLRGLLATVAPHSPH